MHTSSRRQLIQLTQPSVALASEMVAIFSDASPPLEDVYRQLLNFIEVYEYNGFSNFASLQLTLWHLDPLRDSAFIPLPQWIRQKKAVVNITGTGNDCFKWAALAGMHPVGKHEHPDRMSKYEEHVNKYDFSSLRFPVPLSSIGSLATTNNLSINVYGVGQLKLSKGLDQLAKTLGCESFWTYSS